MQTYLVAPSDKLFMVGFGELRVQRHHLQRKSKTRGVTALEVSTHLLPCCTK